MKKNKKKIFVLALLLFAAIGVVGYGVYSYYYTEGTIENESATSEDSDNVIRITGSFDPYVSQDSGINTFLGDGGTIELSCPERVGVNETATCSTTLHVYNRGSRDIRVSYYDVYSNATSSDASVSVDSTSMRWSGSNYSDVTISPNSSSDLNIDVVVSVGDSGGTPTEEPQLVTSPVDGGSLEAYVSFRLDATENVSGN